MTLTGDAAKVAKLAQALGASKSKAESAVKTTLAKSSGSSGGSSKALTYAPGSLETMTVAQATAAGRLNEYNDIVKGFNVSPMSVNKLANSKVSPIAVPPTPESPFKPIVPIAPTPTPELTTAQDTATKTFQDYISELTKNEEGQASLESQFAKAEKDAGIAQKQQLVNDYTLQQNQIIAQQQADILQARNQSSVEGGTAGILSAREDAINRSAAIKLLPIQAQLAAAQDNLEYAQERMNTLFDLKVKDAQNKYEFKNKLLDATYSFMSAQQKEMANDIRQQNDNEFTLKRDKLNYLRESVMTAYKEGNTGLAAALSRIDENSSTVDADIASAFKNYGGTSGGGGAEIDRVIDINGVPTPIDKYGNVITIKGGTQTTPTNELIMASEKQNIDNIEQLLTSGGMSTAVGTNILSRSPRGVWGTIGKIATVVGIPGLFKDAWKGATGQRQDFIAGVEQLQSQLSLDSLINAKAKGATFGALSDTEMRILSASASKIGSYVVKDEDGKAIGYNTTEANFQKELNKINNFAKLDYLLKGGNLEDVGAIQTPDGAVYVKNFDGTLTKLR